MTATMTNLAAVMGGLNEKKQAAELEYLALVESMAGGEQIPPDVVAEVLGDAGRTADQFQADAAHKAERLRLKGLADRYPAAEAELVRTRQETERLEADLERVTARLSDQIRAGRQECERLAREMVEAKAAGRDLLAGYRGPLREQAAAARRRIDATERTMDAARKEAHRLAQQLAQVHADPTRYTADTAGRLEGALVARRRELAAAEAERDAALAESNDVTAAMRQA